MLSLASRNLLRTAITLSSCNGAPVSVPWMRPLCLASRLNAQHRFGIVGHLLLHGVSIQLRGFLFAVVIVHDGSIASCTLRDHHLRHRHWAFCDLRHEDGDLLDVKSGIGHHLFRHVHRDCFHGFDHGSTTMRDFVVSCGVLLGSLSVVVVCCGACSVSCPQPSWRTGHGCTVGIDRDPPCDALIQAG